MRRLVFCIFLFQVAFSCFGIIIEETGSFKNFLFSRETNCEYDRWVSHISEGVAIANYNLYAPWDRQTNGFGTFHVATATELIHWNNVITEIMNNRYNAAQDSITANNFPYKVVRFNDIDTGRTYYLLRENLNMTYSDDQGTLDPGDDEHGSFSYGWGLYVYYPQATSPIIVTVVHPNDDFIAPYIAANAFVEWNAMFLQIAGAGREIVWTGNYTNSTSLSDPSRIDASAYTYAYKKFCNKIREQFGKREMSFQIHSYDWNRHAGYASNQVSAGYNSLSIDLPVRDLSNRHEDMISHGRPVMIPANTIGIHREVTFNDYYAFFNHLYPITYTNADTSFACNTNIDLTGFSENKQAVYTLTGMNDNDVVDPFVHIEMDELPNCYDQTTNNLNWFYGYDPLTVTFNLNRVYDHAWSYYSPMIHSLAATLPSMFTMNDNQTPTTPTNLEVFSQSYDYINLQWDRSYSYDFKTYEIMVSTQPITGNNYTLYTRDNDPLLASQANNQISVVGLGFSTEYYFKIRAKDYNGNISGESNMITVTTGPAKITNLTATGKDNHVSLRWNVSIQNGNQGFIVYRKLNEGQYQNISDYHTNATLLGSTQTNMVYTYEDITVSNGEFYTYKISAVNTSNIEYDHNFTATCSPRPIYRFYVYNSSHTVLDSVAFANNPFASDGNDTYYDIVKTAAPASNYVYATAYEQYWSANGVYLAQETRGDYDLSQEYRSWALRIKTDRTGQNIIIKLAPRPTRQTEKLYLYYSATGEYKNMVTDSLVFQAADVNYRSFILYWGNLQPTTTIPTVENRLYQAGDIANFSWNTTFNFLVGHYDIFLDNEVDSILVASNLPYNNGSYQWTVPQNVSKHNLKFKVQITALDGEIRTSTSTYSLGLLPLQNDMYSLPGLAMISNPWSASNLNSTTVFGTGAELSLYTDPDTYTQTTDFHSGTGYWSNCVSPFTYTSSLAIQKTTTTVSLQHGWNLVPNPHMCSYQIKDLKFLLNNVTYNCGELLEQNLISRAIYVYRRGICTQVDVINPFESFYLYVYANDRLNLSCQFTPYFPGNPIHPSETGWQLKIFANQTGLDKDELIVGASASSIDDFDYVYDLPEPPIKPVDSPLQFYIEKNAHTFPNFPYRKLNCEFKQPFASDSLQADKFWNFTLVVGSVQPVTINCDKSLFPRDYSAQLIIGTDYFPLSTGVNCTFIPTAAGTYYGQVQVRNNPTSNQDTVQPQTQTLAVYPNPFNPSTTISFMLNKSEKANLTIYNIRGQKVRELVNSNLTLGRHHIAWNGKNDLGKEVATGVYFARLTSNSDKAVVKKLMLIK